MPPPGRESFDPRTRITEAFGRYARPGVLAEARRAPSSILVRSSPSFPYMTKQPDGSYVPTPPSVAAAARTPSGWIGWRGNGPSFPLPTDAGRDLDRILGLAALWREPESSAVHCTDASPIDVQVRHMGRERISTQACGRSGLNGRLAGIVLAGRVTDWSGTPPEALPRGIPLRRLPEAAQKQLRYNSGIQSARTIEVHNPREWQGQWLRITRGRSGSPPPVDFSRDRLLLAAMGTQPTGGYAITIERVIDLGDTLEAHVVRISPGRSCGRTGALTAPMDIVLVPASTTRVRWVTREEVRRCP